MLQIANECESIRLVSREVDTIDDEKIIELFFERSESAIAELDKRYGKLCASVLRGLLSDESDIDECLNDVRLAVWNSIPPNRPSYLASFVCQITRRIAVNRFKYNTRQKRDGRYDLMLSELEECLPDNDVIGEIEDNTLTEIISDFLQSLDTETQVLFVRRYISMESVSELAKRYGMRENTVAARLFRARKRLEKILEKENILYGKQKKQ